MSAGRTIGIVGAGAVARALARTLGPSHEMRVWARRAEAAAQVAGATRVESLDEVASCDVVIVAVKDDAIGEVAQRLADAGARGVVLHTSGATSGAESLAALLDHASAVGSLHPLVAVSRDVERAFDDMPFATEATTEVGREVADELVRELGGEVVDLPGGAANKAAYHALATMVATGVVSLVDHAARALAARGDDVDDERRARLRAAYARLAESAARNVRHGAGADVLTGAVARGDEATVARHRDALRGTLEGELYDAIEAAARRMLDEREARES